MSSSPAPYPTYPILDGNNFNNDFFTNTTGGLSLDNAYKYFLRLTGGTITGSLTISQDINIIGDYYKSGNLLNFAALSGVIAGTVSASKAVIVDANRDITNFNNLTATNLTGTNSLTISNGSTPLNITNTSSSANFRLTIQNSGGHTDIGTWTNNDFSLNANNVRRLTIDSATGAISNVVSLTANTNIAVNRTTNGECFNFSNGTVSGVIHCVTNNAHIGTSSAHNFNIQTNGSNALQCLANGDVNIVNNLQIGGTSITATANELNILDGVTATAAELNYNDLTTGPGTAEASKALILDANRDITNIRNLTATTALNVSNSSTPMSLTNTSSSSNYQVRIDSVSGNIDLRNNNPTNSTLLALVANGKRQLTCINNNDIVNIVNHNGSTTGLSLNGTLITATASELNVLDGITATTSDLNSISGYSSYLTSITPGIVTASKGIVVDSSKNISGFNNMKLQNYGKFYVNSDLSNEVYITSSVNNDIIAYSDSISSGCFKFQNPSYGSSPLFVSGSMLRLINGHTSFNLEFNYNSSWDFRSSGSSYDIMFSPNGTMALDCLATDSTINIPIGLRLNKATGTQTTLFDAKGSNSYLDGSYNRFLRFEGANANPVIFELQVHSGNASTASNAAYFGTISENQLRFGTNNSTRMCIDSSGRVGIGTNSPAANLSVSGSTNITLGVGLQTVYQFDVSNGTSTITNLGSAPVTTAVSATFSSFINCSGIKQVSDGRLKSNIKNLDLERAKKLYNINAVNYNWIKDPNGMAEIGVIAQDVMDQGLVDLVAFSINEELKADDKVLKDGVALNIIYDRITCYLLELVQDQNNRIHKLENIISNLDIVEE